MSQKSVLTFIVFVIVVSCSLGFNFGEIVSNSNLNSNTNGWTSGDATWTYVDSNHGYAFLLNSSNSYAMCTTVISQSANPSLSGSGCLYGISFRAKNNSSNSVTLQMDMYDSIGHNSTRHTMSANQDWTRFFTLRALTNTDILSTKFTTSIGNVYIDDASVISYPSNGSFEKDDTDDLTSLPKDTIPGFWYRGITCIHNQGTVDPLSRGCVWATISKIDTNYTGSDGSRVGLLALPQSSAAMQEMSRINFYRDIQYPYTFLPTPGTISVKARCKSWTNSTYWSNVTAGLYLNCIDFSNNITTSVYTTTPVDGSGSTFSFLSTSWMPFNSSLKFGWLEIANMTPSTSSYGSVLYLDDFITELNW